MNRIIICLSITLCIFCLPALAQKNEAAVKLVNRAITLEDSGKMDSVLTLLQQAAAIEPDNASILYEIGYYYSQTENYDKAIETFTKVKSMPGGKTDRLYQMLGNSYDYKGDSANAVGTYKEGIAQFPKAGSLYLEIGNVLSIRKHYLEALSYYEKGIEMDPQNPSNYYRATIIWNSSNYPIWGIMYGELFMNLERNTKRTREMSKWIGETYFDNIKTTAKDSARVSFYNWVVEIDNKKKAKDLKKGKLKKPFGSAYEETLLLSLIKLDKTVSLEDTISYEQMCTMRNNFIGMWYERGFHKDYPNALFEYQYLMKEKGLFNAYNHWLLSRYSTDGFEAWQKENSTEWDNFVKWFKENPLQINNKNRFLRTEEEQ